MGRRKSLAFLTALALYVPVPCAAAQQPSEGDARRLAATREELSDLLSRVDPQAHPVLAGIVQERLTRGDVRPGDGVALVVDGEPQLSDTFVVDADGRITLSDIGPIELRGVLYSELGAHLRARLSQFVRDPVVRARGLVRVLVTGAVARPGFYLIGADALISETITVAGGVTADAKLKEFRAMRTGKPVLGGAPMQVALAQGWTLDRSNLGSGDEFVVPGSRTAGRTYDRVRTVGVVLSIPLTIYSLTRIF